MTLKGKKIAVLGTGEAGRSAARYLHSRGAIITCCDRLEPEDWEKDFRSWCEQNKIQAMGEDHLSETDISGFDLAVASPGIPPGSTMPALFKTHEIDIIGELALAASLWPGRLLGITGTNGKTTTTELTSHILTCSGISNIKAGNISPPLFELLPGSSKAETAVLEISSFQLEYFPQKWPRGLKCPRFSAAVLLNLAPDHLDRHGSMEEYARSKSRLFHFQKDRDVAVLGKGTENIMGNIPGTVFSLDLDRERKTGAFWDRERSLLKIDLPGRFEEEYDVSKWKPWGRHNMENLAAAVISARISGAEPEMIQKALATFRAPDYRLQKSAELKGITFINDSKATNISALVAALESIEGEITLIAGGRGKGEDFDMLASFLKKRNGSPKGGRLKNAILIGEEAQRLKEVLVPFVKECRLVSGKGGSDAMEQAVKMAASTARPGSTVLLSPACASFDMFKSYKERGRAFDQALSKLK